MKLLFSFLTCLFLSFSTIYAQDEGGSDTQSGYDNDSGNVQSQVGDDQQDDNNSGDRDVNNDSGNIQSQVGDDRNDTDNDSGRDSDLSNDEGSIQKQGHSEKMASTKKKTIYKDPPPIVNQLDDNLCWAASLESWLDKTPGRAKLKRDNLPKTFPRALIEIHGVKYLDPDNFREVAYDPRVGMEFEDNTAAASWSVDKWDNYFYKMLSQFGLLYVGKIGKGTNAIGHVVVVYGIGYPDDGYTRKISYMDPWTGSYENETVSSFVSGVGRITTAWQK